MVQISASVSSAQVLPPFLASSPSPVRGFSTTLSQVSGDGRSTAPAPQALPVRQPIAASGKDLPDYAARPAATPAAIVIYARPVAPAPARPTPLPPVFAPDTVNTATGAPSGTRAAPIDLTLPAADVVALKNLLPPIALTATKDDGDAPDGAARLLPDSVATPTLVPGVLPLPLPVPAPLATAAPAVTITLTIPPTTPPVAAPAPGQQPSVSTAPVADAVAIATTPPPAILAADGTKIIIEPGTDTSTAPVVARPSVQASASGGARATPPTTAPTAIAAPSPTAVPSPTAALIGIAQPAAIAFAGAIAAADTAGPARRKLDDLHEPVATPGATAAIGERAAVIAVDLSNKPIDLRQQALAEGLAERIEALRDSADATSSRIRLVPEGLGKIDIALRRDGETLHVHFAADVAATRVALTEAQPKLAEIAAQRGLALGDTSVGDGAGRGASRQATGAPVAPVPVRPNRAGAPDSSPSVHRIA